MDVEEYLIKVFSDIRSKPEARSIAENLLKEWHAGIIVSPSKLRRLRVMVNTYVVCKRLQSDGTCAWLRTYAVEEGLRKPFPGEKVHCNRTKTGNVVDTYEDCNGYIKGDEYDNL